MPFRKLSLLVLAGLAAASLHAANLDGSPPAVGDDEAARLYREANDYVTNVTEGGYSYAYIQFYWRRADSFLSRAMRVYPDSPTAQELKAGRLKVGPFSLDYFQHRVLARLEEKRSYAVDAVTCANFLYELRRSRRDPAHQAAFEDLIETLARQQRWGEIEAFPAPGAQRVDLLRVMFRTAVRDDRGAQPVVAHLLAATSKADQAAAGFVESQAEAYALLGTPRSQLAAYLDRHPQENARLAALRGMALRDAHIRRAAALRRPPAPRIATPHYFLVNLSVRDDVEAAARGLFPAGLPAGARDILASYHAFLGQKPAAGAPTDAWAAYVDYLGTFEQFDELESVVAAHPDLRLAAIEAYAQAARLPDAERWLRAFVQAGGDPDEAGLAEFRGHIHSDQDLLVVRENTFADLPLRDPCVLAQAILEWSIAPQRTIRGPSPWDAVVLKFAPGFANLPPPKPGARPAGPGRSG